MIVGCEEDFHTGQHTLEQQRHTSLIVNLLTTTIRIIGDLSGEQVDPLVLICQHILTSLAICSSPFPVEAIYAAPPFSTASIIKQQQLIQNTCDFLFRNLDKPHTLSSICKTMHTNKNTLSQAFKQHLNMGVSSWLRKKRMEKAKELLLTTDLNIQEISNQVGYSDQANFSTTFKAFYHHSPLQLRKQDQEC